MDERQTALDRIRAYRATLLQRLEYELVRFRCRATVADVQKFIYEREEGRPVSEYISQLIAVFNPSEADLDDAVSVVQDAWNFLPHRVYGGRSPAEVMIDLEAKQPPRPRRARSEKSCHRKYNSKNSKRPSFRRKVERSETLKGRRSNLVRRIENGSVKPFPAGGDRLTPALAPGLWSRGCYRPRPGPFADVRPAADCAKLGLP
jgi:hypothetical protein